MKTEQIKVVTAFVLFACGAWGAEPNEVTLKVGDAAPKLQVSRWVQGDPVKEFEKGKAYIVEFWATWCGPCRVSIPHLNKIHNQFKNKGLVVIGQDVWEEEQEEVPKFVKKMGDKMTYRVALDTVVEGEKSRGKMAETWMTAAGQNGIPTAFVVDKQTRLAWIGHPMELEDRVIEQVLDGTYDLKKAAADYEAKEKRKEQMMKLYGDLSRSMQEQDWEAAESKLAEIEKVLPEDERGGLDMARFGILLGKKSYKAAYALAARIANANKDNPGMQNALAWEIATRKGLEERDLDLAEKLAQRANDETDGKDPAIIDTLARVLFMKGRKEKAIALQQKAVDLAEGKAKEHFEKTLDSYKQGKLPTAD